MSEYLNISAHNQMPSLPRFLACPIFSLLRFLACPIFSLPRFLTCPILALPRFTTLFVAYREHSFNRARTNIDETRHLFIHGIISIVLIAFMNKAHRQLVDNFFIKKCFSKCNYAIFESWTKCVYYENEKLMLI